MPNGGDHRMMVAPAVLLQVSVRAPAAAGDDHALPSRIGPPYCLPVCRSITTPLHRADRRRAGQGTPTSRPVSKRIECIEGRLRKAGVMKAGHLRSNAAGRAGHRDARRVDGVLDRHPVVDEVEGDLEHRIDDGRPPGDP